MRKLVLARKIDAVPELTAHQQAAYAAVQQRLGGGARYTTLRGYAGTGKTFLIARLVDALAAEDRDVKVCAPTHKAAQVLRSKITHGSVQAQTIHALLGLRLVPDGEGGYTLAPEKGRKRPSGGVVIVDEASMIGQAEWEHIERAKKLQWLFVGDPAQLPPVQEEASPVFDREGPTLEEIVRQAQGNPILELAWRVRSGAPYLQAPVYANDQGVAFTRRAGAFLESALRAFRSEAFQADGAKARVLAYRNAVVRAYNRRIRAALHGQAAPRFVAGEWLFARDTWYHEGVPYLINSEELQVKATAVEEETCRETGTWKVWVLTVRAPGDGRPRYLRVLHEDEQPHYERRLAELKGAALEEKGDWAPYYALKERFAQVDYAYAMTVHKAQGSTFETAFVDHRDLAACRGTERQALVYVAVTRPSERLALLV